MLSWYLQDEPTLAESQATDVEFQFMEENKK